MFGPICKECGGELGRIELDPVNYSWYCPACDIEYTEKEVEYGEYHVTEVSRNIDVGDTLLVRLEEGKVYLGIIKTAEGYQIDMHNGSRIFEDADGNPITITISKEAYHD